MRQTSLFLSVVFLLLGACQTVGYKKPPVNEPSTDATIQLAEAAMSISDSMHDMSTVEKIILPANKNNAKAIPNIYAFHSRASIDWSGPIEELVERIAKTAHYRFQTMGKAPAIPVLVSLTVRDETLVDILRNVDYQAGNQASIFIHPNRKTVELRYAKLY